LSLLVRLGLVAVALPAALPKLADLRGSRRSVQLYDIFPLPISDLIGVALPIVELALALLFLSGLLSRYASILFGLMLIAFIAGIISAWARGLNIDCGCYAVGVDLAVGQDPEYLQHILRDTGFLAMTAFLAVWPGSAASADRLLGLEQRPWVGPARPDLGAGEELRDGEDSDGGAGDGSDGQPEDDAADRTSARADGQSGGQAHGQSSGRARGQSGGRADGIGQIISEE
jgi:uncharacterized membrane protein YphA (DoxX/SURF4 family)